MSSIHALQDWVEEAVGNLRLPAASQPVTVLDLGSSEGRNAIAVMAGIVQGLRQRTRQTLRPVFSDLASNDFNQLFANVEEARRRGLFGPGVFPAAVGGSFYSPLLPPATVHLATSFNAIQWLDRLPTNSLPDGVGYLRPQPHRPGPAMRPEVTAAFTRQAEEDLVRFLECRARELVSGGKLLVAGPGDSDQARVGDGIADLLNDACLDLVAAGRLQREEYQRLKMPCYFRTAEEMVAPLERRDSPVWGAFTVDRVETLEAPAPFLVEFRRGGDVTAYARAYAGFLRAITEPVVRAALNHGGHDAATVESLYVRIRARLLSEPERYLFRYIVVAVLLTRR
jgi:hypothetical protein